MVREFPKTEQEFADDERISFSRLTNKWTLETEDGDEYEYDETYARWIPVLDEETVAEQQAAYRIEGVDDEAETIRSRNKKRKQNNGDEAGDGQDAKSNKKKPKTTEPKKNTSIYVQNLPPDATVEEIHEVFSRCGVINEELDTRKPRIKLYYNEDGSPKGECLITYFRAESVQLAIQMLDDSDFRFGVPAPGGAMKVSAADWSYKKKKEKDEGAGEKKQLNAREKKKIIKKTQKLNNKLADWSDDEPTTAPINKKYATVVILKHMFSLSELSADPSALSEITADIREEMEKLGEIANLTVYDREKDGVVSIKFEDEAAAQACVKLNDGRMFAGEKIEAYIYDGSERFRKAKKERGDKDEEEEKRLEAFGDWLENEDGKEGGKEEKKETVEEKGEEEE